MLKDFLFELVSIPSINGTEGEIEIAKFIYDYLMKLRLDYNSDNFSVFLQDLKDDVLGRKNVIAVLKGKGGKSNKCIVFLSHFDTVDIEDYGNLKKFAFNPLELKEKMRQIYPEIVRDGIEFGRGIFDMKAGIVVNIEILKRLLKEIDNWAGYVVFLFVCDEEGDSKGMINSLYFLRDLKMKENLEFLFCLDTDYTVDKAVYVGSVGKILLGIFVRGIESHVGQSLEGLNSNYILTSILSRIDDNLKLVEFSENEFTSPPVVMKVRDLRENYNVKTNLYSYAYVNHLFFEDNLYEILGKYKSLILEVVSEIIEKRKGILKDLSINFKVNNVSVYTLEEFCSKYGKLDLDFYRDYDFVDYRDGIFLSLREWVENLGIDFPFVLVFFLPPYYPSVKFEGYIKDSIKDYVEGLDEKLDVYNYFPYISDLSFLGGIEDIGFLSRNMLGWGRYYYLDAKVMNEVKMPCLDWGVVGFDAHKFTERVDVDYSLGKLPGYIYGFIRKFLC